MLNFTIEQKWTAMVWREKSGDEITSALGVTLEVVEEWEQQSRFQAEIAQLELDI